MFGNLVQRLQTLSPLTSPVTSPVSSPKPARKRYSKSPAARRSLKEEYREIQSDPEDHGESKKCRAKRKVDKLYGKKVDISGPLQGSKSMGRLDGLKQVGSHRLYPFGLQELIFYTKLSKLIVVELSVSRWATKPISAGKNVKPCLT